MTWTFKRITWWQELYYFFNRAARLRRDANTRAAIRRMFEPEHVHDPVEFIED